MWAVFGGFILHFLLSNYLTVLLRPRYEEPVETAEDLIKRDITLVLTPEDKSYKQAFAESSDPNYQEISRTLILAKDWGEYEEIIDKVVPTGLYAGMGTIPYAFEYEFENWYRGYETIAGNFPYSVNLANKKWPLKKVCTGCPKKRGILV